MMRCLGRCAVAVLLLLAAAPVRADELYDGDVAWIFQDYARAIALYRPAAERGNRIAQRRIGHIYASATYFWTPDYAQAAKWFRRAADQGDADAEDELALLYRDGQGVARDYGEALRWLHRAAAKGNYMAQYHLGQMFSAGQGVPHDDQRAYMWFSLSAAFDAGDIAAARDAAARHLTGPQIAQAQQMAQTCQFRSYRGCD